MSAMPVMAEPWPGGRAGGVAGGWPAAVGMAGTVAALVGSGGVVRAVRSPGRRAAGAGESVGGVTRAVTNAGPVSCGVEGLARCYVYCRKPAALCQRCVVPAPPFFATQVSVAGQGVQRKWRAPMAARTGAGTKPIAFTKDFSGLALTGLGACYYLNENDSYVF